MNRDITIDVHLGPAELHAALREDVVDGLLSTPKELPPKWFYDHTGSRLFDEITKLSEYYPTEAEREILLHNAPEIIAAADADTIVELGSGTSDKTLALLDAAVHHGRIDRFVPFDVSEQFLRSSVRRLAEQYPKLDLHGVVGDFDRHLHHLPSGGRRLVVFLGGTIGNYQPVARKEFLARIVDTLEPGDHVLLGTDLVKSTARLELAYNDPAGVTEAFNKNILEVINRELGADFDTDLFDHVARWDAEEEWIDIGLLSRVDQRVRISALDLDVSFKAGELMRTEVSAKFRPARLADELAAVGLGLTQWYTDHRGDYGVSLSVLR